MDHNGGDEADQDRRYWAQWSGKPKAADRDEAIRRLGRLTAAADPAGEWDRCRLYLGALLAERAGFGFISGWVSRAQAYQAWQDGSAALELFAVAAASRTLSADELRQARIAHARLAAGLAVLRCHQDLAAGRRPDLDAVWTAMRGLPAGDELAPALRLAAGVIQQARGRLDRSLSDQRNAVKQVWAALEAGRSASWRELFRALLAMSSAEPGPAEQDVAEQDGAEPGAGQAGAGEAGAGLEEDRRDIARDVLTAMTGVIAAIAPAAVPAGELADLAREGLASAGPASTAAGLHHAQAFLASYARTATDGSAAVTDEAIEHLQRARELLPADHPVRQQLLPFAGLFLSDRFDRSGALVDRDAADLHEIAVVAQQHALAQASVQPPVLNPAVLRALTALNEADDALRRRVAGEADRAIAKARREATALPPASRWRSAVMAGVGERMVVRAGLTSSQGTARREVIAGLRQIIDAVDQVGADGLFHEDQLTERAARAQAALGQLTEDRQLVDAAVASLRAAIAGPDQSPVVRARRQLLLGHVLSARRQLSGEAADLDDAIATMKDACRVLAAQPGPVLTAALADLAGALQLRGDPGRHDQRRAIETGMRALSERSSDVLLQTGARRGLEAAGQGSLDSATLASWCLADGRPADAVQALELGRAMVLHAIAVAADVPALLGAAGSADLADLWQQGLTRQAGQPWDDPVGADGTSGLLPRLAGQGFAIPDDVRQQVLGVLRCGGPVATWLTPLDLGELTASLRRTGYDAFVYLVPSEEGRDPAARPACALVVGAGGALDQVPLPLLSSGPVEVYRAALQALVSDPDDGSSARLWRAALGQVCDWAWDAVTGPVVGHVAAWGLDHLPRLVLIPTGNLGCVPWHAARTAGSGARPRYAIEDAVFSYAASAGQLARASLRTGRPWTKDPVIVADPGGDLRMARIEAGELRRFYPGATFLGRLGAVASGRGTPEEVLARLPGGTAPPASLLHCGCHATVAGSLSASHLTLAGRNDHDRTLTIAQIAAQAQGRDPAAAGFLAVLGACLSDLTDVDHDEALTLAAALLAAGATGVIGARWPVQDLATAQLMVMFHHYLSKGARPADALRAAQLWMLDPGRPALGELARELAESVGRRGLAEVHAWAAFTYQGA